MKTFTQLMIDVAAVAAVAFVFYEIVRYMAGW